MKTTIRTAKEWHNDHGGFVTRQAAAEYLGRQDGSNIDRTMQGYPVLMLPRKDGKSARMYHILDVADALAKRRKRAKHAPDLFDKQTIAATAKDARKAQRDKDIATLINAGSDRT